MIVHIDRLGRRLLRCGVCRQRCRKVHSVRKAREWRDLSMRKLPLRLRYRPRRVECPRCGLRVEDVPWADPWPRVTTALSNPVARLARELRWQGTAEEPLESDQRSKRAAVDAGAVEPSDRTGLLSQRSLSTILGLSTAQAGRRPPGEMDAF